MAGTGLGRAVDRGRRRGRPARASGPGRLRLQLAGVVLAAVVLFVLVVSTALQGIREVQSAHADVASIVEAQRYFQDADMAHDSIRADSLTAVDRLEHPEDWASAPGAGPVAVHLAVDDFLADLRRVDAVGLPSGLDDQVQDLRPLVEAYARDARALADLAAASQAGADTGADPQDVDVVRAAMVGVLSGHDRLLVELEQVTEAMSVEAGERGAAAAAGEREVRTRVLLSAAAALLGMVGLAVLLDRLGGRLAAAVARERGVAETLQLSLLPEALPDLPGVRLAARYRAGSVGTQVGGDWYDVIVLPGGRVGLVIGDVVGHDLKAASAMGQLRNALRACAAEGEEPDVVLARLNRLCVTQGLGDVATVLYAVLDPVDAEVRLASAGHYPPLLLAGGTATWLEAPAGPPVGAVREPVYACARHALPAGGLLLLYTDGLVERRGEGVERGMERLRQTVLRLAGTPGAAADGAVGAAGPDGPGGAAGADGADGVGGAGGTSALQRRCDDVLSDATDGHAVDDDVALLLVEAQPVLGPRVEVVWPARAETLSPMRHLLGRWLTEAGADDEERYDLVVAVSEAATNAVEHAYGPSPADLRLGCEATADGEVVIVVRDWGRWRAPRGQDRGRGTGLMDGLVHDLRVAHGDTGTEVTIRHRLRRPAHAGPPGHGPRELVASP